MPRPEPVDVTPKPGIFRAATPFASSGRWFDANLVRWRGTQLQPVGGWAEIVDANTAEVGRDVLCWHDNDGTPWTAIGTHTYLFAYNHEINTLYNITPAGVGPLTEPGPFNGYGLGTYGTGTYGTPRGPAITPQLVDAIMGDIWSLALWGEDLLVVPTQDGRLFRWSPQTPATLPAQVPNSPTGILGGVFVTDERAVIVFGAEGDPRRIDFCDQEEIEVWAPVIDNLAGSIFMNTEGRPLAARKAVGGHLIFTDNDAHRVSYVGPPYGYGVVQAGQNCGILSRRAVASNGARVQWVSPQSLWQYDGSIGALTTDVSDWFFSLINREQVGRIFGMPNAAFNETWFFFPSEGSLECSRYIALDNVQPARVATIGQLARTAGDMRGSFLRPIMCAANGKLMIHEYGYLDNGNSRVGSVYCETGDIVLNGAADRFHVTQIVHDFAGPIDRLGFKFTFWEEPDGQTYQVAAPVDNTIGLTDIRFSGRGCRMRIEQLSDGPWQLGRTQVRQRIGGKR